MVVVVEWVSTRCYSMVWGWVDMLPWLLLDCVLEFLVTTANAKRTVVVLKVLVSSTPPPPPPPPPAVPGLVFAARSQDWFVVSLPPI